MNLTSLEYTGSAKIELTIKGKTFTIQQHNTGTYFLLKNFAKILTGELSYMDMCSPKYLSVDYVDTSTFEPGLIIQESDWKSYVKQPIELTSKKSYPSIDNSVIPPYAEFVALLLSSNLIEIVTEIKDTVLYRISLISDYDPTMSGGKGGYHTLATLPVATETLMKVTPGTQATITWDMKVTNKTPEES